MAEQPTTFDKVLKRLKNNWALAGLGLLAALVVLLGTIAGGLRDIVELIGLGREQAVTNIAPSTTAALVGTADSCRFIVMDGMRSSDGYRSLSAVTETTVKFDGVQVGPTQHWYGHASTIVVKTYDAGTYRLEVKIGKPEGYNFHGDVYLTNAVYYHFAPYVTFPPPGFGPPRESPISLREITRQEAEAILENYKKGLPRCEGRRIGLSWSPDSEPLWTLP